MSRYHSRARHLPNARTRLAAKMATIVAVLALGSSVYSQTLPLTPQPNSAVGQLRSEEAVIIAVRSTFVALQQANATGNYTVFRDLAAPGFAANNSATDLARIFANIRQLKIDLTPIALIAPKFSFGPAIDQQNMLRVGGTLAAIPIPVKYELAFQLIGNNWRLFGIGVVPEAHAADKK